jgi:response regulator RpfG family c-di-GMP phosphodiesterase
MTHKLLIVDDETANLRLLERLFAKDFECLTASSGADAIQLLEKHDVALLISDQRMPVMTGIELLKRTAALRPQMVRILLTGYTDVEALVEAINSGLVYMYITKPWNNDDLKLSVSRAIEHYQNNKGRQALADANRRLSLRLEVIKRAIVRALGEMLKVRDEYASAHVLRVRDCALTIAAKMHVREEHQEELAIAALLHDLSGTEAASHNPTRAHLSPVEQTIQAYSECEKRLLHAIPELVNAAEIVSYQQENFDGSGRPRGLAAEQIPLLSRILRVADEYDRMVLPRGAARMTHDESMRFLIQRSGNQFDPTIVDVLSQLSPADIIRKQPITNFGGMRGLKQDDFGPVLQHGVLS